MIQEIFKNDEIICHLDDRFPALVHRWLGPPSGDEFKANLIRIQQEYIRLKASYPNLAWLADTTLLGELDLEIENWLITTWEDLLFNKAGLRIHAVVLGPSIYADYPMEKFKLDAEKKFGASGIALGVFSNVDRALAWTRKLLSSQGEKRS
ncbi:MAG: hypothetical protein SH819_14455 [Cytophagales bacterium]|nr:hypothetical protein [Cytophagales bacterium]